MCVLGCTSLPLNAEGTPPSTVVRVRSYKNQGDKQALATIGHTEIIQVMLVLLFLHGLGYTVSSLWGTHSDPYLLG